MSNDLKDLRDFLFRGLMLESEATAFQAAGIQVGAEIGQAEERLLSEAIAPFGVGLRNRALEMGRLYVVLHCFENSVRALIRETLEEKEGADWALIGLRGSQLKPKSTRRIVKGSRSRILGLKVKKGTSSATWTLATWPESLSKNGLALKAYFRPNIG